LANCGASETIREEHEKEVRKLKRKLKKLKDKNRELEEANALLADHLVLCADAMLVHSKNCSMYNLEDRTKIEKGLRPILDAGGWPIHGKEER